MYLLSNVIPSRCVLKLSTIKMYLNVLYIEFGLGLNLISVSSSFTHGFFTADNRYLTQKTELTQRKVCGAGVHPLNQINVAATSVRLSENNPNYEFGGVTYTIRDLKEVPREKVQLVK